MKINTPYFVLKIEILLLIVFLISILSEQVRMFLSAFYICYLFIIFHELSHMFTGVILGKETKQFSLSLSGVCISFHEKKYTTKKKIKSDILKDILIYIAGPISNIIIAIVFNNIKLIFEINLFFAILNLIPLYPLDGYNILYSILKLFNIKEDLMKFIFIIIENILIIFLSILALVQMLVFRNASMIIFIIYVIIQKKQREISEKNAEILRKIAY